MSKYTKLPNQYAKPKEINPGQKINQHLRSLYKQNQQIVSKIDEDLKLEGAFNKIIYDSSLNFLMRRLVYAAHFIHRVFEVHGDGRIRAELRRYLREHTRYENDTIIKLVSWLTESVANSNDDFNSSDKKAVKEQIADYGWGCFICGRQMDMSQNPETHLAPTADHLWPRVFGGESELGNLRYTCADCNGKYKKDFLDYSD